MDSCMNRYANWCKLKVEMSMHHAYDKSWKTMGDISNIYQSNHVDTHHMGFFYEMGHGVKSTAGPNGSSWEPLAVRPCSSQVSI